MYALMHALRSETAHFGHFRFVQDARRWAILRIEAIKQNVNAHMLYEMARRMCPKMGETIS